MERCQNLPLNVDDFEGIGQFARSHDISLVVVGPELPLALESQTTSSAKVLVFGPTKQELRLRRVSLGQSSNGSEDSHGDLLSLRKRRKAYVKAQGAPIVVADGLAAGKVTVAATVEEAFGAIEAIFRVSLEALVNLCWLKKCLTGQVSVLALTDGLTFALLPAQDHKQVVR